MKIIKKILVYFVLLLVILNVLILISGNSHLYLGLLDTYFKGRTKPGIDAPDFFPTRRLETENPVVWPLAHNYNTLSISEKVKDINVKYGTVAFLVIHKDSIVHEEYFDKNYDKNTISNSFSMAKTILSIITGIAVKEGKIDLNERVCDIIPDIVQKKDSALKVIHLVNMTSGMNFDESYGNPLGFMAKAYYGSNLRELVKGYELDKEPGTEWEYLGGNNIILSLLLEKKVGMKVGEYANERLWKKIHAENDAKWILDSEGGDEKTFSGFYATARDFAKLGDLYMKKGNAYGEQIVDTDYVNASIVPVNLPEENGDNVDYYGYAWWLNKVNDMDVFYMRGILGQYVFCIPDKDLIIVRLGRVRMDKTDGKHPDDVNIYINEGLRLIQ